MAQYFEIHADNPQPRLLKQAAALLSGGGILAVVPDHLTLVVWSPALDETGNSVLGQKALELFTQRTGLSIF